MPFRVGVAVAALLIVVVLSRGRFCAEVTLPSLPDRPIEVVAMNAVETQRAEERSPAVYAAHLGSDARAFGISPAPSPAEMGRPFPYRSVAPRIVLDPANREKNDAEILGLLLTTSVQEIEGTPHRQTVLSIANTTEAYLAYRVETRPSRGTRTCHQKRDLPHNAIAIAPGEVERRSECLWNRGWTLEITRVEVIEMPVQGFRYASLAPADRIGVEPRTGRGHRAPDGEALCRIFHSAELENQLRGGAVTWRDMVDFYARHRCKTYSIPIGYKAVEPGGSVSLPAAAEAG